MLLRVHPKEGNKTFSRVNKCPFLKVLPLGLLLPTLGSGFIFISEFGLV